jgi:hypothetical protein
VIHDLEERNHICRSFRCSYYVLNKSLTKKLGLDIPSELKKMWLERLGNGYDREKWITEAVTHLMKAGDRLTKTYMLAEMMTE